MTPPPPLPLFEKIHPSATRPKVRKIQTACIGYIKHNGFHALPKGSSSARPEFFINLAEFSINSLKMGSFTQSGFTP